MKRSVVWLFLAGAPVMSASSLDSFQATCSETTGCSGNYNDGAFVFSGPFPNVPYEPFIDFSIGTHGGSFTYGGNTCNYDVVLGHGICDGEISMGARLGPPDPPDFHLEMWSVSQERVLRKGFFVGTGPVRLMDPHRHYST